RTRTIRPCDTSKNPAITGTFAGLPEGAVIALGATSFRINYNYDPGDGSGGVVLTAVATTNHNAVVRNTHVDGPAARRTVLRLATANPGPDTITFAIPGTGVHTIRPLSALPAITDPVLLDGWSEGVFQGTAGYQGPPLIELDGSGVSAAAGAATTVSGTLSSPADTTFPLDFYPRTRGA